MSLVRVRPKRQITIPANIAREAGIKPDDLLEVKFANGVVTLQLAGSQRNGRTLMDYAGIARGAWGRSAEEIDARLADDRAAWER
jgi:AbrB family looped-hinge helix DNA binding protein